MIGPIGEAILPEPARREGAAFVRSITLIDGSIIARFSVLIMVPVPCEGNASQFTSL